MRTIFQTFTLHMISPCKGSHYACSYSMHLLQISTLCFLRLLKDFTFCSDRWTDGHTYWVTSSLLELLIAAINIVKWDWPWNLKNCKSIREVINTRNSSNKYDSKRLICFIDQLFFCFMKVLLVLTPKLIFQKSACLFFFAPPPNFCAFFSFLF